jgi:hypothetical protein
MFEIDPNDIITLIIMYPQSTRLRLYSAAVNVSGFWFRCKKSGSRAKSEKTFTIRKVNHFH